MKSTGVLGVLCILAVFWPTNAVRAQQTARTTTGLERALFPFGQHDVRHYEFAAGSSIHEHFHPEEEVYEVIEGELEVAINGTSRVVKPDLDAIVPANSGHSVRALTNGRLIIVAPLPARF